MCAPGNTQKDSSQTRPEAWPALRGPAGETWGALGGTGEGALPHSGLVHLFSVDADTAHPREGWRRRPAFSRSIILGDQPSIWR